MPRRLAITSTIGYEASTSRTSPSRATPAWPDGRRDIVALASSLCVSLDEESPFDSDGPLAWLRLGPDGKMIDHFVRGEHLRYRDG